MTASWTAFRALLLRDLAVLRKTLKEFLPRTCLQPFLLVFVFTYVFPKIGQGVGGAGDGGPAAARSPPCSSPGVVGRRDPVPGHPVGGAADGAGVRLHEGDRGPRARAAAGVDGGAGRRSRPGAIQGLIAALIVFPIAAVVPATAGAPARQLAGAAHAGAAGVHHVRRRSGSRSAPASIPGRCRCCSASSCIPLTFLGCIYYPWTALGPIKVGGFSWLQILVLINPLVYMCEGFRAALTTAPHMSLAVVYLVLAGFAALFLYLGINGFKKRVLS